MPAGDGTGPKGMGPTTGRAAGVCAGFGMPGYMNPIPGRGCGMGFGPSAGLRAGRGRGAGGRGCGRGPAAGLRAGWRNMFHATGLPGWACGGVPAVPAPAQELAVLKQQAEQFGSALQSISKRVQELETQPAHK